MAPSCSSPDIAGSFHYQNAVRRSDFFYTWFGNSDFRVKSKPYLCYIILLQVPPPICEDYLNAFSWSSSTIMIVETDLNPYKSCILGSRNFRIKYLKNWNHLTAIYTEQCTQIIIMILIWFHPLLPVFRLFFDVFPQPVPTQVGET